MRNPLERYLGIAADLTGITAQTAERFVQRLVKEGEVAADRAERVVADLLAASQRNREMVADLVRAEVDRAIGRLNLTSLVDMDELTERVVRRLREDGRLPAAEPGRGTEPATAPRAEGTSATRAARSTTTGARTSAAAERAAAAAAEAAGEEPTAPPTPRRRPRTGAGKGDAR